MQTRLLGSCRNLKIHEHCRPYMKQNKFQSMTIAECRKLTTVRLYRTDLRKIYPKIKVIITLCHLCEVNTNLLGSLVQTFNDLFVCVTKTFKTLELFFDIE